MKQQQQGKKRRVSFDFEFVPGNPCLPISVGLYNVETGEKLYREWLEGLERAGSNEWLRANVLPHLKGLPFAMAEADIAADIRAFLAVENRDDLELYAECGAYDFFLLSETLGGFSKSGLPYTFREVAHMGLEMERRPGDVEHHALCDAVVVGRALRRQLDLLSQLLRWEDRAPTFDFKANIDKIPEAQGLLKAVPPGLSVAPLSCQGCRHLQSRVRKDEPGPTWNEAYCGHEDLAAGEGGLGIPASCIDEQVTRPRWCPRRRVQSPARCADCTHAKDVVVGESNDESSLHCEIADRHCPDGSRPEWCPLLRLQSPKDRRAQSPTPAPPRSEVLSGDPRWLRERLREVLSGDPQWLRERLRGRA